MRSNPVTAHPTSPEMTESAIFQPFYRRLAELSDDNKARLALAVISEFLQSTSRRRGKKGFVSEGRRDG